MITLSTLIAAVIVVSVECKIECYTCVAEEQVLKDQYISMACDVKEKCINKNYCMAMTWMYNGLSYQKRGCIQSDKDYPCNRLWSECERAVCSSNSCNGATSHELSVIILLFSALLLFVLLT